MDVLADLLSRARARGAAFASTTVHGDDWGLRFGDPARLVVHVIVRGQAVITTRAGVTDLEAGDVVAVRSPAPHSLAAHPRAPMTDLARFVAEPGVRRAEQVFCKDGPGAATSFVCGAYRFDGDLCSTLLEGLPEVVVVRSGRPAIGALIDLLTAELQVSAPGRQTVLDRLLDVLLISILRAHFQDRPESAPRWYAGLADAAVGAALRAIHTDPTAPFTVAGLARVANVSRATLAHRFTDLVGEPPLAYLTGWRLRLAKERLRETDEPLAAIARKVGYSSGYALAAAFKRENGVAPGAWRSAEQAA